MRKNTKLNNSKTREIGRPAKFTADFFDHRATHTEERHIRRLERKWGSEGYAFYYKLQEQFCLYEHHYIDIRDELDKEDFIKYFDYINNETIEEMLDYLRELGVLDNDLYENGIIYLPDFVNRFNRLYVKRTEYPKRPAIDYGGNFVMLDMGDELVLDYNIIPEKYNLFSGKYTKERIVDKSEAKHNNIGKTEYVNDIDEDIVSTG